MVNEDPEEDDSSTDEEEITDEESDVETCTDTENEDGKVKPILLKKAPEGWKKVKSNVDDENLPKGWTDSDLEVVETIPGGRKSNQDNEVRIEFGQETKEKRPIRGKVVRFKLFKEEEVKEGIIKQVGKQGGKDKNICWVLENGEADCKVIDFVKDVETWKYKLSFAENETKDHPKE